MLKETKGKIERKDSDLMIRHKDKKEDNNLLLEIQPNGDFSLIQGSNKIKITKNQRKVVKDIFSS